ncbi:hypothetical protein [Cyclobacterium marinum]|uniref:hypothetical protein n=1 Tax=Cyclobacterium marinum TaxID=104 RepID=UPI0011F056CA|nr:hypothetical protein [Cyclobacterium marinum]MBI0401459.1 hypothetical protein [Cyclobacterium marinum]
MDIFYKIAIFNYSKRFVSTIIFATLFLFLSFPSISAIPLDNTCYRSNLPEDGVGDWDDPNTWEQYNGAEWIPATDYPKRISKVFIGWKQEVRLTQSEEVGSLYLFAETISSIDPGKKLNLQTHELWVFGQLHSITEEAGNFEYFNATSGITDWIYPETGTLVFKGKSRTIVDRNSWSASNLNSRFGVIFAPDGEDTLVVNAAFKANSFVVESGAVKQTVNEEQTPFYTSTFSFNIQDKFGTEDYGDFRILSGATLISEGTKAFNQIIRRSDSRPASSFVLEEGANLMLSGERPIIDAVSVQLDGNVIYAGEGGSQELLESTMTTSEDDFIYNNLYFSGAAEKVLPLLLKVKGDLIYWDGGTVNGTSTRLIVDGTSDQLISIPSFQLFELDMNKEAGMLILDHDLIILQNFEQLAGDIDFSNNSLFLDFGPSGTYHYSGGNWHNLEEMVYQNLPEIPDQGNALFPFFDNELGFPRHLLLDGNLSEQGNSIAIRYFNNPGVTYDPGFNDVDGTKIVFELNSYFEITASAGSSSLINLWVLADDLGIQDVDHVRLTGNGEAAAGLHLPASELSGKLWAGRTVVLNELLNNAFAISSINELSVLPLEWMEFEAFFNGNSVEISWVNDTKLPAGYTILRADGQSMEFNPIEVLSSQNYGVKVMFHDDYLTFNNPYWYYQVKAEDEEGELSFSPVLRVDNPIFLNQEPRIHPMPYTGGEVHLDLFDLQDRPEFTYMVWSSGGVLYLGGSILDEIGKIKLEEDLKSLPSGSYFIQFKVGTKWYKLRWIKVI